MLHFFETKNLFISRSCSINRSLMTCVLSRLLPNTDSVIDWNYCKQFGGRINVNNFLAGIVQKKILVLDLDETLIHSHHDGLVRPTVKPGTPPDFILRVESILDNINRLDLSFNHLNLRLRSNGIRSGFMFTNVLMSIIFSM